MGARAEEMAEIAEGRTILPGEQVVEVVEVVGVVVGRAKELD